MKENIHLKVHVPYQTYSKLCSDMKRVLPMNFKPFQDRVLEDVYVTRAKPKIFQEFAGASVHA